VLEVEQDDSRAGEDRVAEVGIAVQADRGPAVVAAAEQLGQREPGGAPGIRPCAGDDGDCPRRALRVQAREPLRGTAHVACRLASA
jgi:hypothetical protein